jgi:hypothetical protein
MGLALARCTDLAPTSVRRLEALGSHMGQRTTTDRALALFCRAELTMPNGANAMRTKGGDVE